VESGAPIVLQQKQWRQKSWLNKEKTIQ